MLERASIEGEVFRVDGLSSISSPAEPRARPSRITSLVRKELIRPSRDARRGQAFRFRHALIRDAAYEGMSKGTRSELHQRHAAWLEQGSASERGETRSSSATTSSRPSATGPSRCGFDAKSPRVATALRGHLALGRPPRLTPRRLARRRSTCSSVRGPCALSPDERELARARPLISASRCVMSASFEGEVNPFSARPSSVRGSSASPSWRATLGAGARRAAPVQAARAGWDVADSHTLAERRKGFWLGSSRKPTDDLALLPLARTDLLWELYQCTGWMRSLREAGPSELSLPRQTRPAAASTRR